MPDHDRQRNGVQNLIHIPDSIEIEIQWDSLDVIMLHLGSDGKLQDYNGDGELFEGA